MIWMYMLLFIIITTFHIDSLMSFILLLHTLIQRRSSKYLLIQILVLYLTLLFVGDKYMSEIIASDKIICSLWIYLTNKLNCKMCPQKLFLALFLLIHSSFVKMWRSFTHLKLYLLPDCLEVCSSRYINIFSVIFSNKISEYKRKNCNCLWLFFTHLKL